MALIWLDGFEAYGTGETSTTLENLLKERYTNANMDAGSQKGIIEAGTGPGKTLSFGDGSINDFLTAGLFPVPDDEIYVSFKFFFNIPVGSSSGFLRFFNPAALEILELGIDDTKTFFVHSKGSTDQDKFYPMDWYENEWNLIEMYAKTASAPNGAYEVRINGVTVSSGTGLNTNQTGGTTIDRVVFQNQGSGSGRKFKIKDIVINDGTGTVNNTWIGDKHVFTLFPNGDTADEDWALSAGTDSFALVNEASNDGGTSYIESSTATEKTILDYGATGSEANIIGVSIHTVAALDAAGSETFDDIVAEGATETDSAAHTVASTSYAMFDTVYETNPDTGVAWTAAELDAIQGGVKFN